MDNRETEFVNPSLPEGDSPQPERESVFERKARLYSEINNAVAQADLYVRKAYLDHLNLADILTPTGETGEDAIRLVRIDQILYDQSEQLSRKICEIFGAVESYGGSIVLLLNGKKDRVDLYMGIGGHQEHTAQVFKTFLSSLSGALPGCQYRPLRSREINQVLDDVFPQGEELHLSAISAFPLEAKDEAHSCSEKLDVLIDSMRHKPFSMMLIARAETQDVVASIQRGLESLYTQISPLQKQDLTYSTNESSNSGFSYSKAISESLSCSEGVSYGYSVSDGTSQSIQKNTDDLRFMNHQSVLQLAGSAAALLLGGPAAAEGANLALQAGQTMLQRVYFGQAIGGMLVNTERAIGAAPENVRISETDGTNHSETQTANKQENTSVTNGTNDTSGVSCGVSGGSGESMQMSTQNKTIANLLEMLDAQIKQLEQMRKDGTFNVAAYFVAGDQDTAVSAANLYRSITTSARTPLRRSPIYQWNASESVASVIRWLRQGRHPVFLFKKSDMMPKVEAAQMLGLKDIPSYFALPEKSIPGLVVSRCAQFSRDIIFPGSRNRQAKAPRRVHIGYISHMGREERQSPVYFDVENLTKHLFVAGATGVGKSNFCYQLLDQLDEQGVKMLIVEPAKGEYARVLGGRDGFSVYGIDPRMAPMIRINPFAFPDGISAIQHIERLLDIFNAAWPMYSAMPAILKEAVESIYIDKGIDLTLGIRPPDVEFPCFAELLDALPRVIARSAYSEEVKGNYIGALVTRVRSLTNGLYGMMFGKDEIGDAALFDANVIVDISRVGSAETKALLMGVLVMRLMEYRMVSGRMNSPLNHVTLLEEAHHLLRGSTSASAEGVNLRGASVEMISSAIAEMRTFGEGFIIADQSPSMIDLSAIRNTQTKVFFMLPEQDDRRIAGASLSLKEEQQQELARLQPGMAAVYQNGWMDAVLCKINFFGKEKERPFIYNPKPLCADPKLLFGQCIAAAIKYRLKKAEISSLNDDTIDLLLNQDVVLLGQKGKTALSVLQAYRNNPDSLKNYKGKKSMEILEIILPLRKIVRSGWKIPNMDKRVRLMREEVQKYAKVTEDEFRQLVALGLLEWKVEDPAVIKEMTVFYAYCFDHPATA